MISMDSISSAEDGDDTVWFQIGRELEDVGITPAMVTEHRTFITNWIKDALDKDQFEESVKGPVTETDPSTWFQYEHDIRKRAEKQKMISAPPTLGNCSNEIVRCHDCVPAPYRCNHPSCAEVLYAAPTVFDLVSHLRNVYDVEDDSWREYVLSLYSIHCRNYMGIHLPNSLLP